MRAVASAISPSALRPGRIRRATGVSPADSFAIRSSVEAIFPQSSASRLRKRLTARCTATFKDEID